jgi:dTDP-glucose 4,6-dehydratase
MRLLVTGGCGFIGSNFIMHMLESYPDVQICNLDLLICGKPENLQDAEPYGERHRFIRGSITDKKVVSSLVSERPDAVINFAAESHVDRSIMDCSAFVVTNICGTQVLLDACREFGVSRFVQISTDEVYGSLGEDGAFTESCQLVPQPLCRSRLSRSAGAVLWQDLRPDAVITRCSNNYGPFQFLKNSYCCDHQCLQDKELPRWRWDECGLDTRKTIAVLLTLSCAKVPLVKLQYWWKLEFQNRISSDIFLRD